METVNKMSQLFKSSWDSLLNVIKKERSYDPELPQPGNNQVIAKQPTSSLKKVASKIIGFLSGGLEATFNHNKKIQLMPLSLNKNDAQLYLFFPIGSVEIAG